MRNTKSTKLNGSVRTFLQYVDEGVVSLDTRSPFTRDLVKAMRDALVAESQSALSKPQYLMPEFKLDDATGLRTDLIKLRDEALGKREMRKAVTLNKAIVFVWSAVRSVWNVDLTAEPEK